MADLTSEQVTSIAKLLNKNANSIDEYLNQNYEHMSPVQNSNIKDLRDQILEQSSKLYTESTILVMDDVQNTLDIIEIVTSRIQKTYKNLKDIQKAIDIASSVLNLGAAILSKDPKSIVKTVSDLVKNVKAK
jgi:hypothetical protein